MSKNLLQIENLSIRFPKTGEQEVVAVNQLNFTLKKGESLGIVGESGSGKSMTALAIMQLLPKTASMEGKIIWNNSEDLAALDNSQMRQWRGREIGMIFQEPLSSLNPVFTCGDQVAEVIQTHFGTSKKQAKKETKDWFEKVQLAEPSRIFDAYPHQLSGGQRQRVMIAMALCGQPDLLICDEPTTALDVTVQYAILDLLMQLRKETAVSIVFISHDLAVIRQITDRVLIMQKGNKVEEGRVAAVFETPQNRYTQGLLACRPPLNVRLSRLPVIEKFIDDTISTATYLEKLKEKTGEYQQRQEQLSQSAVLLEVNNLHVRFPKEKSWYGKTIAYVNAVDGVSLRLRKGESLGLVGESGSGKTTLGKAILRLVKAQKGRVQFLGQNTLSLEEEDLRILRPKMQMVFQDPYSSLNPKMRIDEMLLEPLNIHQKHLTKDEKWQRLLVIIKKVGLTEESLSRHASEFSGGQRQRIGLARALLLQPELLICDESVSALDVSVQAQVLNLIKDLKEAYQFSLIFITHDLSVVKFIADTICVMKNGVIVERNDTESLFAAPQQEYTKKLLGSILDSSYDSKS